MQINVTKVKVTHFTNSQKNNRMIKLGIPLFNCLKVSITQVENLHYSSMNLSHIIHDPLSSGSKTQKGMNVL